MATLSEIETTFPARHAGEATGAAPRGSRARSPQPTRSTYNDWLFTAALPIWWSLGADRRRGGFREALDQSGRPARNSTRLRVQARQVYVYATARKLGWRGPWLAAVEHGLEWLFTRHLRDDGLYRTLVGVDGEPIDDAAKLYDQAFVLLALASAAAVSPRRRSELEGMAAALFGAIAANFAHPAGGFRENDPERTFQANAHMHLFEAALAWTQVSPHRRWRKLADDIGDLCCRCFIDPRTGALREFFDAQWRPASGELGDVVEPGHQFEWAWLLQQWQWLSGHPEASAIAERLFELGEEGVDHARGVAQNALDAGLSVRDACARLWPQTERLKAAHLLAEVAADDLRRKNLEAAANSASLALWRYLQVDVWGLWRDVLKSDGDFVDEPAPASSFYHIMAAIAELNGLRIVTAAA
jgi:mannose-6-phosphate isomerase